VETAVNETAVAIAGCGAVTALGLGIDPLRQALRSNASGLSRREHAVGRTTQSIVTGSVPDAALEQLRNDDSGLADSRVFLFARAALTEAASGVFREGAENSARGGRAPHPDCDSRVKNLLSAVSPSRRALVLSTTKANIEALEKLVRRQPCSATSWRHIQPAFLAADLAAFCGAAGPVQCVSAACISGLLALQQGAVLIRRGLADLVFVVGVDALSEFVLSGFASLKSLDPEGCRPFDKARVGLSVGEGAGAIMLVKSDLASFPVVLVSGWGSSNDANHLTGPSRDGSGLVLAITRALAKAGVAPESIDYVNAHGTGTPYNDAMESLALRAVFNAGVPPFSSSKGLLGHTLGAAGVLETILCVAAMETRWLPGTPRLRERDPVAPDSLLHDPRPAPGLNRILKVNCGFGGTNAAVVLSGWY
jgi:3-oxoacyl-(acyl-carrier-protein) synthase